MKGKGLQKCRLMVLSIELKDANKDFVNLICRRAKYGVFYTPSPNELNICPSETMKFLERHCESPVNNFFANTLIYIPFKAQYNFLVLMEQNTGY